MQDFGVENLATRIHDWLLQVCTCWNKGNGSNTLRKHSLFRLQLTTFYRRCSRNPSVSAAPTMAQPDPRSTRTATRNLEGSSLSEVVISPWTSRTSPTCVTETETSSSTDHKNTNWENPRFKYFQEKRLRLCQQRVQLEQRLFEFAADSNNDASVEVEVPGKSHVSLVIPKLQDDGRNAKVSSRETNSRRSEKRKSVDPADPNSDSNTRKVWSGAIDDKTGQPHGRGRMVFPNGQVYMGEIDNGVRHGVGSNQWPNGQFYRGEWLLGSRTGRGTHEWPDGRKVTGQWLDGHLHGRVFYTWPDEATYDGDCWMGKKHGRGISTSASGSVYQGQYCQGHEHGFGTLTETDASGKDAVKYRGQFRQGQRHGYGIQIWRHKTYDGEWKNNAMEGRGKLTWNNGAVYTGQVRYNRYHGNGCYMDQAGNKFVGHWQSGVKEGNGVQFWRDGSRYTGSFLHGRRHGYGRMSQSDGSLYCGGWKDGKRNGRGIQVSACNEILHCGLWTEDQPVYKKAPKSWHDDLDVTSRTTRSDEETDDDYDNDRDETLNYSVDSPLTDHDTFVWESP
jgi:hypothetical protein